MDREQLGWLVREVWISWAREQPTPKPSWLVPWEGLSEPDREVDRRIGEAIYRAAIQECKEMARGRHAGCLDLAKSDALCIASGFRSPFLDRAMEAAKIANLIATLEPK